MCETKCLNKLQHSPKYSAKSFLMQNNSKSFTSVWKPCFNVNYSRAYSRNLGQRLILA